MEISPVNQLIIRLVSALKTVEPTKLTDRVVAERLGITPSTLSKWQRGHIHLDQLDTLLKLLRMVPEERWLLEIREVLELAQRKANTGADSP